MSEEKKESALAGVARMFRPDPAKPSAPPPSCCGECGGGEKKKDNNSTEKKP
jgi:hypothetical protein